MATGLDGMAGRAARAVWRVCAIMRGAVALGALMGVVLSLSLATARADGRYAAMAVDANSGQILHSDEPDAPRYPASLAKVMTLFIVFEEMERGRLKPETRIRISEEAASAPPSRLGLDDGDTISVADAIRALITKSANDISIAIAEHIAGSEERFATLMTRRARELGMNATTFRNAHGLPDSGQVTTARDMLTLGLRLYDHFPQQARLFALRSFQHAGRTHRNHNTMLASFSGMEGIKTGFTQASGFNLLASVRQDGRHVIGVVFGGSSAAARNARMRVILSRALQRATPERTRKPLLVARRFDVPTPTQARRPAAPEAKPARAPTAPATAEARSVPREAAAAPRPVAIPAAATSMAAASVPSPRLVEPVAPISAASGAAAPTAESWRSQVRVAAPIAPGASVASRISGQTTGDPVVARPPSTLNAQAAQIGSGPAPGPAARIGTGLPPAGLGAPRAGGVAIQIGAFGAPGEAMTRLEAARQLIPQLLARATPTTPAVNTGGRTLYRARFVGLDAAMAASACTELRRRQVDCLVASAN